jgi:hypothetical protein
MLKKEKDYKINYLKGVINLNITDSSVDTLVIYYTPLPPWLNKTYGLLPQPDQDAAASIRNPSKRLQPVSPAQYPDSSRITVKGAKRFSILSQTEGASQFNQSLNLTISGELSPGLEISGSVADRGYDPAYGTLNSQISELDKLNLRLQSKQFYSEVGHLEIAQASDYGGPVIRQVNGIRSTVHGESVSASGLFARPRGQIKTSRFYGSDVWLDGQILERGADKDYIMDYPSGSITFTQRVPIDSRSRMEIDFEPIMSQYQRELYQLAAGLSSSDSLLYLKVGYTRQGDDRERPQAGDLSIDDILLLRGIGDSVTQNNRDGAMPDSLGNYVERYDSLGHRYFEYVGDSLGNFRVSFTSVGSGRGEYIYEGNDIYRFVGSNKGDHLPIISVPVPSREEFYETELGARPGKNSLINLIIRQSAYDRNLYSNRNDNNNVGGQYILTIRTGHNPGGYVDENALSLRMNIINRNFKPLIRRNRPDLSRTYLIPAGLTPAGDEKEVEATTAILAPGPYNAQVSVAMLDYDGQFESYYGMITVHPDGRKSILPSISYLRLKAAYDTAGHRLDGENERVSAKISFSPKNYLELASSFSFDRRWNQYRFQLRGTTELQYDLAMRFHGVDVKFQHYDEDTLRNRWDGFLQRDRASISFAGGAKSVKGNLYLIGQRLDQDSFKEDQFMARVNLSYLPPGSRLSAGVSYALSDENRSERGLRYLEVEPGQGKFIYQDGQYIPDPEGNFIEIEEIHSGLASVDKGEKSFNLTYNPKEIYVKLASNVTEEMLAGSRRTFFWILPFFSDGGQPYLFRKLYYSGELKLAELGGYYFLNLEGTYNYEGRRFGESDFERYDKLFRAKFNEALARWRFYQEISYFEYHQDSYYSSPGNVDGVKLLQGITRIFGGGQFNGTFAYRYATDARRFKSRLFIVTVNPRIRIISGGETSFKLEAYNQKLTADGLVSYRLTDNHPGRRGLIWSWRSDYRLRKDLRISVGFDGRHSDEKKPRIVGKGELIASF